MRFGAQKEPLGRFSPFRKKKRFSVKVWVDPYNKNFEYLFRPKIQVLCKFEQNWPYYIAFGSHTDNGQQNLQK